MNGTTVCRPPDLRIDWLGLWQSLRLAHTETPLDWPAALSLYARNAYGYRLPRRLFVDVATTEGSLYCARCLGRAIERRRKHPDTPPYLPERIRPGTVVSDTCGLCGRDDTFWNPEPQTERVLIPPGGRYSNDGRAWAIDFERLLGHWAQRSHRLKYGELILRLWQIGVLHWDTSRLEMAEQQVELGDRAGAGARKIAALYKQAAREDVSHPTVWRLCTHTWPACWARGGDA